jgi:hypothetical protein
MDIYPLAVAVHQQIVRETLAARRRRQTMPYNPPSIAYPRTQGLLSILAGVVRWVQTL